MQQVPAVGHPSGRRDRWAWLTLAPSGAWCLLLALTVFFGEFSERAVVVLGFAFALLLLVGVCVFAYGSIAALVFLVTGRWRRAVSHLLGIGMLALAVFSVPTLGDASRAIRFRLQLPTYEARIAEWRARHPDGTPARLVLENRDLSVFVTSTLLESIIFDETDAVLSDPCPVLRGDRDLCRMKVFVEPISGHFYWVTES
ncbi:hypothetical protein GGQ86_001813 [Xanthobacter flavus]|uniref:Uncharacterized protein n=1 Tax=Xanthobacter flavus TaxID=281 RepID=A0A9W6CLV3_XANFL|nr:hypothetical protein [Xanthobacter flavus]MDR6333349.1 hypothetical protein [Xanthobacter flavus]GLI21624.1 hypothetical protein XFLAVUS301_12980 [Xanthobacter flavus]